MVLRDLGKYLDTGDEWFLIEDFSALFLINE